MKRLNNVSKKNNFNIFDLVNEKEQIRSKRLIIKTIRERTSYNEHIKTDTA